MKADQQILSISVNGIAGLKQKISADQGRIHCS